MPYTAPIETGLFNGPNAGPTDQLLSDEFVKDLCLFQVRAAERYLRAYPDQPRFWDLARRKLLRYDRTCDDKAQCKIRDYPWRDWPTLIRLQEGDCKSLATALAADMRVRENVDVSPHLFIQQMPLIVNGQTDGRRLYHVVDRLPPDYRPANDLLPYVTRLPNGILIIDPSKALGMNTPTGIT